MADDNPEREQGGKGLRAIIWLFEALGYFTVAIFSVSSIHALTSGEIAGLGTRVIGLGIPLAYALFLSLRGLWRLRK